MTNTTIVTNPHTLSPVNDIYGNTFVFANTSYPALNFKYMTQLLYNGVPLGSKNLFPPRPSTGNGWYSPYNSLLANLTYDKFNTSNVYTIGTYSTCYYSVRYGLDYNPNININNATVSMVNIVSGTFSYFGFSFSTSHGFNVGDILTIQSINPNVNGTSSIIGTGYTSTRFAIDKQPFVSPTSNNQKTGAIVDLQRWNGTSSNFYGFYGTRQYQQVNYNFFSQSVIGTSSTNRGFMTDYGTQSSKLILPNQYETISALLNAQYFLVPAGSFPTVAYYAFRFYDQNNTFIWNATYSLVMLPAAMPALVQKYDIPVGTSTILAPSNTSWYDLTMYSTVTIGPFAGTLTTASNTVKWQIDTKCSIYDNVRVMWLNRWGAWDFYNFRLDNHKSYNISRNEYKKQLDYNYTIGDTERTLMSSYIEEQHVINTDWISESEMTFLNSLLTSAQVFIIDETNLNRLPIIIVDKSFDFKTANRDKIMQLTLTYVTSYDIETQQG